MRKIEGVHDGVKIIALFIHQIITLHYVNDCRLNVAKNFLLTQRPNSGWYCYGSDFILNNVNARTQ